MLEEALSAADCVSLPLPSDVERYAALGRIVASLPISRLALYKSPLAAARGMDPDRPCHLSKVTRTHKDR